MPLLIAVTAILLMVVAIPVVNTLDAATINESDMLRLVQEEEDEPLPLRAIDMVCGIQESSVVCYDLDLSAIQFDDMTECVAVEGALTRCSRSLLTSI